jgi:hypothetical protein
MPSSFRVTYCNTLPKEPKNITSFYPNKPTPRTDLNMELQRKEAKTARLVRIYELNLSEFHQTCASHDSHRWFLRMLLAETLRQNPTPEVRATVVDLLMRTECLMMTDDNYIQAVQLVHRQHMFLAGRKGSSRTRFEACP